MQQTERQQAMPRPMRRKLADVGQLAHHVLHRMHTDQPVGDRLEVELRHGGLQHVVEEVLLQARGTEAGVRQQPQSSKRASE
eukprot:scaffold2090_cov225-Prasinococcus_capsulatus_cf.AAC.33